MGYAMVLLPTPDFEFYPTDNLKPFPNLRNQEDIIHKEDYLVRDFLLSFDHPPVVLKVVIVQFTFSLKVRSLSR